MQANRHRVTSAKKLQTASKASLERKAVASSAEKKLLLSTC